ITPPTHMHTLSLHDALPISYGQIVYSSFLNLGEAVGVDAYVKVLDRQSPEVQQRVRDFLYYPMLRVPKEQRKEVEEENSRMYPPDRKSTRLNSSHVAISYAV